MTQIPPCPCGQYHEMSATVRVAMANLTRGLPEAVLIHVLGSGAWYVPRIYLAAHGLKGSELPEIAARYGFRRGDGDDQAFALRGNE